MRVNPLVCVEWDEVTSHDHWESVIVFGRYEELSGVEGENVEPPTRAPMRATPSPDEEEQGLELRRAHAILREHTNWWQPGLAAYAASKHRDHTEPFRPLYYRIRIDRITGHRATPAVGDREASIAHASDRRHETWMQKALRRVVGKSAPVL
jgi:nitroimidazol reductase NimA-like FMN-containing flavoprotein (pyridoxamine 5'-phosphate oxidase superfamily)